jgi:hypothetical protein
MSEVSSHISVLTNHQRKLQKNLKVARKEAAKLERRILQLLRSAAPQVMENIPSSAGLVVVLSTFLMQWPIFLLATATQKIAAKFTQVGRSVEEMNASLARLAPRTECLVQIFAEYDTRLNGMLQVIEHSVTFENLATTLRRILGTETGESEEVDQQEIQSLLEQIKKRVRECDSRAKKDSAKRSAQTAKIAQATRRS